MENNYSVYQHVTPDGMYYFGQTQNVEKRWSNNGALYKGTALYPYIEKYGWDNIQHIVLFREQTRENALFIEDFLITTAQEDGVCINKNRSGLVSKEEGYELEQRRLRYQKNREKELEQNLEYYQKNRDEILEQRRLRYQKNREKKLEYYQKNREKRLEYQRQRYQRKKLEKQLKEVETTLF